MKYSATIIRSKYTEGCVYVRPAVQGWEIVCSCQPTEGNRDPGMLRQQWSKTVSRKREVEREVNRAVQSLVDGINHGMEMLGDVDEWDLEICVGEVDDLEVVH